MLTWPRQLALNRFHAIAVGKSRGFDPHKSGPALKTYFGYMNQFLCYYYRVVHGRHFKRPSEER